VPCTIETGGADPVVRPDGGHPVKVEADIPDAAKGAKGTFGVRPEDLVIADGGQPIFTGAVEIVEKLGEVTLIYVDAGHGGEPILAKLDGIADIRKGDTVRLTAPTGTLHVFDADGRAYRRRL
jgi:ABC-type sugar transport system ATPase subunit